MPTNDQALPSHGLLALDTLTAYACHSRVRTMALYFASAQTKSKELHMLANASVTTMLPLVDMARARAFYERRLGLMPSGLKPDGKVIYQVGGSTLALFPKPEGTKAVHTAISFRVSDIAASIVELKKTGVVFESYDFPDFKTVDHVCVLGAEKAAWFKDTEGNVLCLHEDLA